MTVENSFEEMPVIDRYTRGQAIDDGVLIDLTEWASAGPEGMVGGYLVPVAVTRAVWEQIEAIPDEYQGIQDVRGRAHDLIWMSLGAKSKVMALAADGSIDSLPASALFQVTMSIKGMRKRLQTYKLVMSLGENGEPEITIMQPHED